MKLKVKFTDEDFELGEIVDASIETKHFDGIVLTAVAKAGGRHEFYYKSIAELNEDWEDYEEPKEYWYIDCYGEVQAMSGEPKSHIICRKLIGDYFETQEEAEKAVEKLKALTRLEEKGFRFDGVIKQHKSLYPEIDPYVIAFSKGDDRKWIRDNGKDLCLLFGGEE